MVWILFTLIATQHSSVEVGFANQVALSLDVRAGEIEVGFVDPVSSPLELPGFIQGTIHSNIEWVLVCSAQGDFLSTTGSSIPIERLAWRIEGEEWVPFEMGEMRLFEGLPTSEVGRSFSMDVRLALKWIDNAGEFLANIDFTLMKK